MVEAQSVKAELLLASGWKRENVGDSDDDDDDDDDGGGGNGKE